MKYTAYSLVNDKNATTTPATRPHHKTWIPARPINYICDTWADRFKHAWGVLIGKYDTLDWEETKLPK